MNEISKKRTHIEKRMLEWFKHKEKYSFTEPMEGLRSCPDTAEKNDLRLISIEFESLQIWYLNVFVDSVLKGTPDYDVLALNTRLGFTHFMMEHADYGIRPGNPGGYDAWNVDFLLCQLLSIGWHEQAEIVTRISIDEFNTFLGEGITTTKLPWFVLNLCRDWLGIETEIRSNWGDIYMPDLGFWEELLAGWREPNPHVFAELFTKAADFHIEQSRYEDEDKQDQREEPEINNENYWLFPVELFAVLRLRTWEGLDNPTLDHPLFSVSMLGKMPLLLTWPENELLDEVERKYRRAYPEMKSFGTLPQS